MKSDISIRGPKPSSSSFPEAANESSQANGKGTREEHESNFIICFLTNAIQRLQELSGSFRPGDPNPDLLTPDEAVRYLRLDTIDIKNPKQSLDQYRKAGLLKGTQVSKRVFYMRNELDAFLLRRTESNPR